MVPTFDPFTFHWYTGIEPPLVGVAVKVTFVPAQTLALEALMLTLAGVLGVIVNVLVAVASAHPGFEAVRVSVTEPADISAALGV